MKVFELMTWNFQWFNFTYNQKNGKKLKNDKENVKDEENIKYAIVIREGMKRKWLRTSRKKTLEICVIFDFNNPTQITACPWQFTFGLIYHLFYQKEKIPQKV